MDVSIRNYDTGQLLTIPKQLYEVCYKNDIKWELMSADTREPMKPTPPEAIKQVHEHIEQVKLEAAKKCCETPCDGECKHEGVSDGVSEGVNEGTKPIETDLEGNPVTTETIELIPKDEKKPVVKVQKTGTSNVKRRGKGAKK